jgi:hypothetical protein
VLPIKEPLLGTPSYERSAQQRRTPTSICRSGSRCLRQFSLWQPDENRHAPRHSQCQPRNGQSEPLLERQKRVEQGNIGPVRKNETVFPLGVAVLVR